MAFLALGANLGDRIANLRCACAGLATRTVAIEQASPVYETDAVAPDLQPAYLNAVLRVRTKASPRALLEACLAVERDMGRVRPAGVAKAPRTIDIDVLLFGDRVIREPGLVVPHPGLLARAFVRIPLADVASGGLVHPLTGEPLDRADADAAVRETGLRLFAPPEG